MLERGVSSKMGVISLQYITTPVKKYKDWSIRAKLLTITAMLILGSVFLITFLSYTRYINDFNAQSSDRIQQIIEQVSINIDTYLDDLFRLSTTPYYSSNVMSALEGPKGNEMDQLERTRVIEGFLDEMMIIPRKDILRVHIFAENVYSSTRTQARMDSKTDFKNFDWYKQALETHDAIFIPVHSEQIDKNPNLKVFSIVSQLRSTKDSQNILGVIKVDANYTGIQSICNKVEIGNEGSLFIIDSDKNMIYRNANFDTGAPDYYNKIFSRIKLNKGAFNTTFKGKTYLVNHIVLSRSNWTITAISSLDELNSKALQTRNTAFLMAFACVILALFILILFEKSFLAPILSIVNLMKEVQKGNLSARFHASGSDEIGYLGTSFNSMADKINEMLVENTQLVKVIYESRLLHSEARFNALQSQIRPHFIYNTLNMISLLVQSGKHNAAVNNINRLSYILRSMANLDKETTIKSEIELLKSYLEIQGSRYGDRLAFSIEINEDLYSYTLPSFVFQPIVENAVIYGCEAKKSQTTIRIYSLENSGNTVFIIEDNGAGMQPDKLLQIQKKLAQTDANNLGKVSGELQGKGIGLVNVNNRIKIKFGQDYGITVISTPGEGTCVKIILPGNTINKEGYQSV